MPVLFRAFWEKTGEPSQGSGVVFCETMHRSVLLPFLLLIGLASCDLRCSKGTSDTMGETFEAFAVKDTQNVGRVFIADRYGNRVIVEREGGEWFVVNKNTGQRFTADPRGPGLLETLVNLRVRRPVPKSAQQTVTKEMAAGSLKIEVYDRRDRLMKAFYLGKTAMSGDGNHGMLDNDPNNSLYVVFIPGFVGDLQPHFPVFEKFWRDKKLFRVPADQIEWAQVEYFEPQQKALSFRVENNGKGYSVTPLATSALPAEQLDQAYAQQFLNTLGRVGAENFLSDDPLRDSLVLNSQLWCRISLRQKDQTEKRLNLYPIDYRAYRRGDGSVGVRQTIERYVGVLNEGQDVFLLQHRAIEKMLLAYPFFYGQGVPR